MADVTQLLNAADQGDRPAADQLIALLYQELRELARRRLSREPAGHTLGATALVHEAYLRLAGPSTVGPAADAPRWAGRGHYFAAAAEAMRRILVESARRKQAAKRGGPAPRDRLPADAIAAPLPHPDLLALDEALTRLSAVAPAKAEVVKLRYFAGLTNREAADALGLSEPTVERHWAYARAWLFRELGGEGAGTPSADRTEIPPAD